MAKSNKKEEKTAAPAASKKPRFKGINHPKNCPKAFRAIGNKHLVREFLGK